MRVKDVMTTDVVTVSPNTPLKSAARLLAGHRISGVPVVDGDGMVVGVLSEGDLLFKERGWWPVDASRIRRLRGRQAGNERKREARTAGEAMSSPAQTIEPWRLVSGAAAQMIDAGVNRLPVVHDGKLVGIVARSDLVRAFIQPDDEIERQIRSEVVALLIQNPTAITVTVEDGIVLLEGRVPSDADAVALAHIAEQVPGVVSVDSRVTAREPARNGR